METKSIGLPAEEERERRPEPKFLAIVSTVVVWNRKNIKKLHDKNIIYILISIAPYNGQNILSLEVRYRESRL